MTGTAVVEMTGTAVVVTGVSVAVTGQMVVYSVVTVVTTMDSAGQLVTVGAQLEFVCQNRAFLDRADLALQGGLPGDGDLLGGGDSAGGQDRSSCGGDGRGGALRRDVGGSGNGGQGSDNCDVLHFDGLWVFDLESRLNY